MKPVSEARDNKRDLAATAPAAAVDTLDDATLFDLALRHAANAVGALVRVARLDTPQTTEALVALLPPLGNQRAVSDAFVETVLVQLTADGLALVEQVIDVARALMVDSKNGPQSLDFSLAFMRVPLGFTHFCVELIKGGLDELPALWRGLSASSGCH